MRYFVLCAEKLSSLYQMAGARFLLCLPFGWVWCCRQCIGNIYTIYTALTDGQNRNLEIYIIALGAIDPENCNGAIDNGRDKKIDSDGRNEFSMISGGASGSRKNFGSYWIVESYQGMEEMAGDRNWLHLLICIQRLKLWMTNCHALDPSLFRRSSELIQIPKIVLN